VRPDGFFAAHGFAISNAYEIAAPVTIPVREGIMTQQALPDERNRVMTTTWSVWKGRARP